MSNISSAPSFFPRRLSSYVPAMAYASDVHIGGDSRVSFGTPATTTATYFLSAQSVSAGATLQGSSLLNSATTDALYGRNVTVVLSGAGTGTVTVDGYDYLMQPMSENLALNGATPVLGIKAFKIIRQVTWPTVGAVTMNMGIGIKLGLPYKAGRILTEEFGGAYVSSLGTLVGPVLTVPATATTGDTRGTYQPTSTMDGATSLSATFMFYNDVDASNNGGLHGVPHYAN